MYKKVLIISGLLSTIALSAFCATYKVNTGGTVTNQNGQVKTPSAPSVQKTVTPSNFYTNYNAQDYVASKQAQNLSTTTVDIVMDYSGSMSYWITAAKQAMSDIVRQIPQNTKIGFRVFGHNNGENPYNKMGVVTNIVSKQKGKYTITAKGPSYLGHTGGFCSATSSVVPVSTYNLNALLNGMNSATIGGSTPLTLALEEAAYKDFAGISRAIPKKIILISDGAETCGGAPCAFARELVARRNDITIDVVLVSSASKQLKCLAQTTGGKVYTTRDISNLTEVLVKSINNAPESDDPSQEYEFINE